LRFVDVSASRRHYGALEDATRESFFSLWLVSDYDGGLFIIFSSFRGENREKTTSKSRSIEPRHRPPGVVLLFFIG